MAKIKLYSRRQTRRYRLARQRQARREQMIWAGKEPPRGRG